MNITHPDLIEFRQRIAGVQRKQRDFQDEQNKLRNYLESMAKKYQVLGLRHMINPDNGEIVIFPEQGPMPSLAQQSDAMEASQAGRNVWTEELEEAANAETNPVP